MLCKDKVKRERQREGESGGRDSGAEAVGRGEKEDVGGPHSRARG